MNVAVPRTYSAPKPQSSAQDVWESIGDISSLDVFHNSVLVAIFIRPSITPGGIHLSDQTLKEDEYQGKAGLVLKKGPLAFKDDGSTDFGGKTVEPGDWVMFRVSDGFSMKINGVMCRLIEDVHIKGMIPNPLMVY